MATTPRSLSECCLYYAYHGFFGIFIIRVPADAHDHFVDITITHAGPAVVDPCTDIRWKIVHHGVREVGWRSEGQ